MQEENKMIEAKRRSTEIGIGITSKIDDNMVCFACNGRGTLSKKEVLKVLGGRDIIDLLELSDEQFFKKLQENSPALIREVTETLEKRHIKDVSSIEKQHQKEIRNLEKTKEKENELEIKEAKKDERKLLGEIADLKSKLEQEEKQRQALETKQRSVPSLKGAEGEKDFEDWIGQYAQFECTEKLKKTGDYIVKVKRTLPNGNLEVIEEGNVIVDCKEGKKITRNDIDKLFRDAKIRSENFAYLLVSNKEQFRGEDQKKRIVEKNGIWLFKGDRNNFLDDMSFLEFFVDIIGKEDSSNDREQKEKLRKLIVEKTEELEEFKEISASIIRDAGKIDTKVDEMRREMKEEVNKIVGSAS
jgi:hypothetical protein